MASVVGKKVNQRRIVVKTWKALEALLSCTDGELQLTTRHVVDEGELSRGWKILKEFPAEVLTKASLEACRKFPKSLTIGRGCLECGAALAMSWDETCAKCHRSKVGLTESVVIKGSGVVAERGVWQSSSKFEPPMFEIQLSCRADGTDFLKRLKSVVSEDLVLTADFVEFTSILTQCQRGGGSWTTWESSPERLLTRGCRITDALWVSSKRFGLQGLERLEELDAVSFVHTSCANHVKAGVHCRQCGMAASFSTCGDLELLRFVTERACVRVWLQGWDTPYSCKCGIIEFCRTCDCGARLEPDQEWCRVCKAKWEDRFHQAYCKNCVGKVRLRVRAPETYADRRHQLERLDIPGLVARARLLGLQHLVQGSNKQASVGHILKAERIIE